MTWRVVVSKRKRRPGEYAELRTFETRVAAHPALDRCADWFGPLARKIFSRRVSGRAVADLRKPAAPGVPPVAKRWFASADSYAGSVVASATATQERRINDPVERIGQAGRVVAELQQQGDAAGVHRKRRRLALLGDRLAQLRLAQASGRVSVAFGSGKLWRERNHLESNGHASHQQWLAEWRAARDSEFFVMGEKGELGGCQLCVATVADDGSISLRLRLPYGLEPEYGKYLSMAGLRFKYGHDEIVAAIMRNADYWQCRLEQGEKAAREQGLGQPLSFRFKRDGKGWRVLVSTDVIAAPRVTDRRRGAVGVDVNADHLAVTEVTGDGNWVRSFRVPLVTYGKSIGQASWLTGLAVKRVIDHAAGVGKPVVMERLNFQRRKNTLEGRSLRYKRMLSSFAYGRVMTFMRSRGHRSGVQVIGVNPAFSSVMGRVKYMEPYGLTVHQAAAMVLARRGLGLSERLPGGEGFRIPDGWGGHVTLARPVSPNPPNGVVWAPEGDLTGMETGSSRPIPGGWRQ